MAWSSPRTWVTSEIVTAALLNAHLRDNLLETATARVTTAGDLVYATGANALARLGIGTTAQFLIGGASAPAWANTLTGGLNIGSAAGAGTGQVFTSSSIMIGDTSNAHMTLGLTINQGAADDEILAFKSSAVAHGMTTIAETDTFSRITKAGGNDGGLSILGLTETDIGIALYPWVTTATTTKSTAAVAALLIDGRAKSGTTVASLGANGNIVAFQDDGTTRFIFDVEGSAHADVEWTTFDDHHDIALLDSFERVMVPALRRDPIKDAFGRALTGYSQADLEALRLIGRGSLRQEGGRTRAMVDMTRLTMALAGALRQVWDRVEEQAALIADMRRLLPAPGGA